jgi:hypothetical protein
MTEGLRYSDRKRVAETGGLGLEEYDRVTTPLRNAVSSVWEEGRKNGNVGAHFSTKLDAHYCQHLGRSGEIPVWTFLTSDPPVEEFLDFIEILAEEADKIWTYPEGAARLSRRRAAPQPHLPASSVRLPSRERPGATGRVTGARRVRGGAGASGRPPARMGARRAELPRSSSAPAWRTGRARRCADGGYGGARAALKAAGVNGDRLSTLAKSLRNSDLVPR